MNKIIIDIYRVVALRLSDQGRHVYYREHIL